MSMYRIGSLSLVRRWWWVVALATGAGGLLALAYGSRVAPTYEAEARLVVLAPGELAPTYAELVRTRPVLEPALHASRIALTPDELRSNVRGEADAETRLLTIRARDRDPSRAVTLANGLATELIRFVSAGRDSAAPDRPAARPMRQLRIVERASDADRVRPQLNLLAEFGALAGFFSALAVAVLVESRSRRVRDEQELTQLAAIAVLGWVNGGALSPELGRSLVLARQGGSDAVESYSRLARRIAIATGDEAPRSLLVVGAQGTEGSGAVAAQLALALAGGPNRVVLADFGEDSGITRFFKVGKSKGTQGLVKRLKPLRHGSITLDRYSLRSRRPLVLVVPRGSGPRSLSFDGARSLAERLLAEADVLVVHGPSPSRSPGGLAWACAVGAAVLVVRPEHTRRDSVTAALQGLELAGTNVVGAVLHTGRSA
jgi:capsular polysaccharide biosynthesis protein/Mrp family chromosome partitioning ATPase